ncbi:MAG TPA: hypothetical protein VFO29_00220 [Candidatus Rubrimentiphilum sp.]|nr:hypothetical protein [Candidatus Rubrimentiphilum sp.]
MSALEVIRADIPDFPGCEGEMECRLSDEQVRSYVGERLAALDSQQLSADEKQLYDTVLYRSEFMNQEAFRIFDENRDESRITAVLDADAALIAASKLLDASGEKTGDALKAINEAFDKRDAAMLSPP